MELIDVHPAEVQPGDYMCINDELIKIIKVYPDRVIIDFDGGERVVEDDWYKIGVRYKRKVGEHPHGIIPDEFGAIYRDGEQVGEVCAPLGKSLDSENDVIAAAVAAIMAGEVFDDAG